MATFVAPNERVAVAGMTGSGKSLLVRQFLAGYPHVLCLDAKGDVKWPEAGRVPVFERLEELAGSYAGGKVIWRPGKGQMGPDYYEAFFQYAYDIRNVIVWVDEVYAVCPTGQVLPAYQAVLTRGRSRGLGCWSCTQRPVRIPLVVLTESEHQFSFRLQLDADRRRMAEVMGPAVMELPGGKHGFFYHATGELDAVHVAQGLKLPKGGR